MNKKWLLGVGIVAVMAVGYYWMFDDSYTVYETTVEKAYVPVVVAPVEKMDFESSRTYVGEAKAHTETRISTELDARVAVKHVKVGDAVEVGTLLYTLDTENVDKKNLLLKIAYDNAKANYEVQKARYNEAKDSFEKGRKLYESGAISKEAYQRLEREASSNILEVYKTELMQAETNYKQGQNDQVKTLIKSPIKGYVATLRFEENEKVSPSSELLSIVNTEMVNIEVQLTENMINKVALDQKIEVTFDALEGSSVYTGTIVEVSPVAAEKTKLFPVKIAVVNKYSRIKPGMFAKISIPVDKSLQALAIKSEAVVKEDDHNVVYLVEGQVAHKQPVETGLSTDAYIEIKSGLCLQDQVVVKGQNFIKKNSQIKVVEGE